MAPVDDSSTKQSANGSLAITFLLSCLRLQSEDSTVKQSQHSTVCARPGGHNGHHVALDNLWPSHGRHRGQRGFSVFLGRPVRSEERRVGKERRALRGH